MTCDFCDEEVLPSERAKELQNGDAHYYCLVRSVVGSVGHQLGKCSCYGGTLEDPPGLTKRQAAIAAYFLNMGRMNRPKHRENDLFSAIREFWGNKFSQN